MWWWLQLQSSPGADVDQQTPPWTTQGQLSTDQACSPALSQRKYPRRSQGELAGARAAPLSQPESPLRAQHKVDVSWLHVMHPHRWAHRADTLLHRGTRETHVALTSHQVFWMPMATSRYSTGDSLVPTARYHWHQYPLEEVHGERPQPHPHSLVHLQVCPPHCCPLTPSSLELTGSGCWCSHPTESRQPGPGWPASSTSPGSAAEFISSNNSTDSCSCCNCLEPGFALQIFVLCLSLPLTLHPFSRISWVSSPCLNPHALATQSCL